MNIRELDTGTLIELLEAARIALSDRRMAIRIADAMDERDSRMSELRTIVESLLSEEGDIEIGYYVVCEVICQLPSVSLHRSFKAALRHATACAMENLYAAEEPEDRETRDETRVLFMEGLEDGDNCIREGDYEVYILTPAGPTS